MHLEILADKQKELLTLVSQFEGTFGLVGGTAIALQLGHRRSIDFDLFTQKTFKALNVLNTIKQTCPEYSIQIIFEDQNELTIQLHDVKLTFYHYRYPITFKEYLPSTIHMPDLLTLACMKAFALGRRAKWKDYVDLYFLLKKFSFAEIISRCKDIFGDEFSEKMFRVQLGYFKDVNYSEKIDFMNDFYVADEEVKEFLLNISLS